MDYNGYISDWSVIPMTPIKLNSASSTYSQQVIKDRNSTLLFNLVRKMTPISRADLARLSGLSPATVTVLMEELLENQWIRELSPVMTPGARGRRPIQLEVNATAGYVATLEILSQGYICSLYDICQNKIAELRCQGQAPEISDVCRTMVDLASLRGIDRLLGIHILYPGLFDTETGHLGFSAVIPAENMLQADLVDVLREVLPGAHIMISNNSTAMAYSVFAAHAPKAPLPLLAISIHEGISAGLVTDSHNCIPLEAGHIIIRQDGPVCTCGNRGCLETICSTTALFREIGSRTSLRLEYQEVYGSEHNQAAMELGADAFRQGDPDVIAVIRDYARALCNGIVSIVNLFAAQSVYIGGAVRLLGQPFVELLQQMLEEDFRIITNSRTLHIALFDDDLEASRKAAVTLTMERLFQRS